MKSGVYQLKQDSVVKQDLVFKSGQEFEVVQNVVYMGGYPLPLNLQSLIMGWMDANPNLFRIDNRNF